MAGKKISELQALTEITGQEMIPVARDGQNYSVLTSLLQGGDATKLNDYMYDVSELMGKMAVRGTKGTSKKIKPDGAGYYHVDGSYTELGSTPYGTTVAVDENKVYHFDIGYHKYTNIGADAAVLVLFDENNKVLTAVPWAEGGFLDKYLVFTSEVKKYGVTHNVSPAIKPYPSIYNETYEIQDINDILSGISEKSNSMRDDFNNYISDVTNFFGKMAYRDGVGTNDKNVSQEDGYYDTRGKLKIQPADFVYQKLQVYPSKIYRIRQMIGSYPAVSALVLFDEHDEIISTVPYNYPSASSDKYFVFAGVHSVGISFVKSDNNSRLESFDISDITSVLNTSQGNRALYVAAGAVYNEQTGFYELNGLTDITEEQMREIYICTADLDKRMDWRGGIVHKTFRTNLGFRTNTVYDYLNRTFNLFNALRENMNLEVLHVGPETSAFKTYPFTISQLGDCFFQTSVKKIEGFIRFDLQNVNLTRLPLIEHIRIVQLKTNINFGASPNITLDSLQFLIQEAMDTSAITVTVHADVYAKIQDESQTEWHALIASAQEKQITFATA